MIGPECGGGEVLASSEELGVLYKKTQNWLEANGGFSMDDPVGQGAEDRQRKDALERAIGWLQAHGDSDTRTLVNLDMNLFADPETDILKEPEGLAFYNELPLTDKAPQLTFHFPGNVIKRVAPEAAERLGVGVLGMTIHFKGAHYSPAYEEDDTPEYLGPECGYALLSGEKDAIRVDMYTIQTDEDGALYFGNHDFTEDDRQEHEALSPYNKIIAAALDQLPAPLTATQREDLESIIDKADELKALWLQSS